MNRTCEYSTVYLLSSAVLVPIPYLAFITVIIEKTLDIYYFSFFFLLFCDIFSPLYLMISSVTTTVSCLIRNTVLQVWPVTSSVFKIYGPPYCALEKCANEL